MRAILIPLLAAAFLALVPVPSALAGEVAGLRAEADSFKEWGSPDRLVDGDPATAWVGGGKGVGPGKVLTFTLPGPRPITRLRIANGNQAPGRFGEFRCVTAAALILPDRAVHWFVLRPEPGEQDVVFPPVTVDGFRIAIAGVSGPPAPGGEGDDKVAVSEVRAFDDAGPLGATVAAGPSRTETLPVQKAPAAAPGGMDYFAATKPGSAWLRTAVPAGAEAPPAPAPSPGVQPWMRDLVFGYFNGLASLDDGYLDVFAPAVRERERRGLDLLRDDRRAGRLPVTGPAQGDPSGLALGKPVLRGKAAMLPVRGLYRFTGDGRTFGFRVDAQFSFVNGDEGWRINGVVAR
ncbi:hypothetical protein [Pseudodesulfovibrio sp.]|uniref:NADase-type glycan-binding domain-containing protein n=1 Tax=Pseudodesulfovibrio sp. TaxID=2035812 RepID=UPI0026390FCC|nr:hypothetical protein [Pseudodesulfovibrio sp.]MDD3313668.1 hypothetical protein [Pseudodesulfovibrio sp.]